MILSAFAVAMINTHSVQALEASLGNLSWITIIILVGSMIMMSTPQKVLVASLIAASMDPLGVWVAHLRGLPVPSVLGTRGRVDSQLRLRVRCDAAVRRAAAVGPATERGSCDGELPADGAARPRRDG